MFFGGRFDNRCRVMGYNNENYNLYMGYNNVNVYKYFYVFTLHDRRLDEKSELYNTTKKILLYLGVVLKIFNILYLFDVK